jgi:hypothetical protein
MPSGVLLRGAPARPVLPAWLDRPARLSRRQYLVHGGRCTTEVGRRLPCSASGGRWWASS